MVDVNHNSLAGKIGVVRAYICGFVPDLIVGVQRDGLWFLPGGIVEGVGVPVLPEGVPKGGHFYPLAYHVAQQTGLTLIGLSEAIQFGIHLGSEGPEAAVLYVGQATGQLRMGTRLDIDALPDFGPMGINAREGIERVFKRMGTGPSSPKIP